MKSRFTTSIFRLANSYLNSRLAGCLAGRHTGSCVSLFFAPLLALLLIVFAGCASMDTSHYSQAVLITSEPPGASIVADSLIQGTTPTFVKLRRTKNPSVVLRTNRQSRLVPLARNYRWHDSFFANLLFVVYAPIGWALDLLTGTAWNIHDSPVVHLEHEPELVAKAKIIKTPVYAIAPPLAESIGLSDAAGRNLTSSLIHSKLPGIIKDYDDTLQTFVGDGFDYDGSPDRDQRRDLYYDLQTDGIFESTVEKRSGSDELVLRSHSYNFFRNEVGPPIELAFQGDKGGFEESIYALRSSWFHILPNAVSLDLVNDKLSWNDQIGSVDLKPVQSREVWLNMLNFISAINLTSLPARRAGRSARWEISAVPSVRASFRDLEASNFAPLANQEFERLWLSVGYGLEVGWQISRHYFYLNLIPQAYWNQIRWAQNGQENREVGTGITAQGELGYVFYFNANWALSLFSRTYSEDPKTWSAALTKASGVEFSVGQVVRAVAGLSISYRIEPKFNHGRWLVDEKLK